MHQRLLALISLWCIDTFRYVLLQISQRYLLLSHVLACRNKTHLRIKRYRVGTQIYVTLKNNHLDAVIVISVNTHRSVFMITVMPELHICSPLKFCFLGRISSRCHAFYTFFFSLSPLGNEAYKCICKNTVSVCRLYYPPQTRGYTWDKTLYRSARISFQ